MTKSLAAIAASTSRFGRPVTTSSSTFAPAWRASSTAARTRSVPLSSVRDGACRTRRGPSSVGVPSSGAPFCGASRGMPSSRKATTGRRCRCAVIVWHTIAVALASMRAMILRFAAVSAAALEPVIPRATSAPLRYDGRESLPKKTTMTRFPSRRRSGRSRKPRNESPARNTKAS